jgi:CheY-like chemotaxis protein
MRVTRVLLVGAHAALADAAAALTAAGYAVRRECGSLAGLVAVQEWQPAVVVLDWAQPFLTGEIFVEVLQTGLATPPLVIALQEEAGEATGFGQRAGVAAVLPQPPDPTQLLETIVRLLAADAAADTASPT